MICGGVSENLNTVAEKVYSGNAAHAIDSKRIMIHDTCICSVVLCKNTKCAGYQQESLVLLLDIGKKDVDEWIYIDIADQHPDSLRFIHDVEKIIGKKVTILKSSEFNCVEDVVRKVRFINSKHGAPCTGMLKKQFVKSGKMSTCNTN